MPDEPNARKIWEKRKFNLDAPDLWGKDADALAKMGDALQEIAPDVVGVFQKHV
ncbi:MAG TPA: hypothetical protein VJZ49_00755 [Syntrophales bacterium]|nr:hypothetical protein [Syntrophales bacterium]